MKTRYLLPLLLCSAMLAVTAVATSPPDSSHSSDKVVKLTEAQARGHVLYAPYPTYPYEARRLRQIGSGIALMEINFETGAVENATMKVSTGSAVLDDETLRTLRRWKFRPHALTAAQVPITYSVAGINFSYKKNERPLAEILAPYLGEGAVRKAKVPEYPDRAHWTFKHGKGRYEIHVDAGGRVENVIVLQSSGDPTFDKAAQKTLGKWQLNRGPLVVELPLSFVLTPNSYRVDVAH